MKKILKVIGIIFIYLLVYLLAQAAVGIIFTLVYELKQAISGVSLDASLYDSLFTQYFALIMFISIIITLIFYSILLFIREKKLTALCRFSRLNLKTIFLSLSMGVILNFFVMCAIDITKLDQYFPSNDDMLNNVVSSNNLLLLFLTLSFIVPLFEEILFRGLIFHEMKTILPVTWAMLLQAVLFGAYHLNMMQALYASLLGLILGLAYEWTGSLWSCVIIHAFFNGTSVFINRLFDVSWVFHNEMAALAVSFVLMLFLLLLMYRERVKAVRF